LSSKEFELLTLLMQHENVPVTHAKILRTIWGAEYADEPDDLRSYVKTLARRSKTTPPSRSTF
jgi:DNA-binding response OmpR family regulator